jgi:hypothetical protein
MTYRCSEGYKNHSSVTELGNATKSVSRGTLDPVFILRDEQANHPIEGT